MANNPAQQEQYGQIANYNISPGTRGDGQSSALEVTKEGNTKVSIFDGLNSVNSNPLNLLAYDYVSMTESPAGTETYTFKTGGSGGTVTNTVVIVYTDATKVNLSTVTKT
jgi:hypothetical protein